MRALVASILCLTLGAAVPATAEEPTAEHLRGLTAAPRAAGDVNRLTTTVPGGLLVTVARDADGLASRIGGQALTGRVIHLRVAGGEEDTVAARLRRLPGVQAVERERLREPARTPDDPRYPDQWAHQHTRIEGAWSVQVGSRAVRVAVIDTGILGNHPDLAANITEPQVSTASGQVQVVGQNIDNDPCASGHGTGVAGALGAVGDNALGVAGVAWQVSIVDVSVSGPANNCVLPDSAILAGLGHATHGPDGPVDVINMSFGGIESRCPVSYQTAIDEARAAGVVVVAAAGNAQQAAPGQPVVPASCNGVISVGATDRTGRVAFYSSANQWVDITAPGGNLDHGSDGGILTTAHAHPIESVTVMEGTSFAAPYVSGVAALLRAERPSLTPDEVESLLERTALDLAEPGRDDATGWGLVQADAAVAWAASGDPVPDPEPDPAFPVGGEAGGFERPPVPVEVFRVWEGGAVTTPVAQAAAVSRAVFFDAEARHAVLARADDFADALAGSALGFGIGPLLFTPRTGPLAHATRAELQRVLPPGSTVYILGGHAALPATLEAELQALGYVPHRLAGPAREDTAAAIADEVVHRGFHRLPIVLLARADTWPDAVTGGSIAAWYGAPVLLTPTTTLHPATAAALRRLEPVLLYALGGTAALAPEVVRAAGEAAGVGPDDRIRLAGAARDGTAVAIAAELELLMAVLEERLPAFVVGVNVRRGDGFAHALSSSVITGFFGAVFVPVEEPGGTVLTEPARDYVRGFGIDGVLSGGPDLISESVRDELRRLLRDR